MDTTEMSGAKVAKSKKRSAAYIWNVLTIVVLVLILCVAAYFILIFFNPNSSLNPFPPPTVVPPTPGPSPTVTPRITMIPTWTPTNIALQVTEMTEAGQTPYATSTPIAGAIRVEPTRTATAGGFAFVLQPGSPSAVDGSAFHPDAGCNWTGVAGQITSISAESVPGLLVQLGGSMPGNDSVDMSTLTGYALQYGTGGYEFTLANKPVATDGTLWIQLMDQQKLPLSDRIYFSTYDDCQKNLIIISFIQVH